MPSHHKVYNHISYGSKFIYVLIKISVNTFIRHWMWLWKCAYVRTHEQQWFETALKPKTLNCYTAGDSSKQQPLHSNCFISKCKTTVSYHIFMDMVRSQTWLLVKTSIESTFATHLLLHCAACMPYTIHYKEQFYLWYV